MSETIYSRVENGLDRIRCEGHLRSIPDIDHGNDLYLMHKGKRHKGKRLLNLASNNYLGLAGSESLKQAAMRAVETFGVSSGASRLITGNYALYDELEQYLCSFKKTPAALVMNSGYAANLGIISSLADRKTLVFSDRLNHASIIDGIILSRAGHIRYRHSDPEHLEFLLQKAPEQAQKILITDTVFSMDGDRAALPELVLLCKKHKVAIIIDEAHATGLLGLGKGLAAELGLDQDIDVQMGTFSKALGSFGGYVAGSRELIDLLTNRARSFIYSTALPPAVVGANLEALRQVEAHPEKGKKLQFMAGDIRRYLNSLGYNTGSSTTQIIPVILGESRKTMQFQEKLKELGIYAGAVRPPTVARNSARLRLCLRADMDDPEIELIKNAFKELDISQEK